MKQGKAINRSRLFQPNPHSCKVGIIDTTIKGKKTCGRDDKMSLHNVNLSGLKALCFYR